MTSSPAKEEVPKLVPGPPRIKRIWLLTHGVLAGFSLSSNPLMESTAQEERLRDVPLPGSVRGQCAICGKRFQPYSYQKAPGHFPVDTSHLGVERQRRRNKRLLCQESAAQALGARGVLPSGQIES